MHPKDTATSYPRSRVFLLRFTRDADLRAGRCSGRIEQVSNLGDPLIFGSSAELLCLLEGLLETDREGR